MKNAAAISAIDAAPVSAKTKNRLRALAGSLQQLATFDHQQVSAVRHHLHTLKAQLRGDRKELINGTLFVVNTLAPAKLFERTPEHIITDHAFCSGLRRYYGVDLNAVKDRMLEISRAEDWVAVTNNAKIVTFYPKSASA